MSLSSHKTCDVIMSAYTVYQNPNVLVKQALRYKYKLLIIYFHLYFGFDTIVCQTLKQSFEQNIELEKKRFLFKKS